MNIPEERIFALQTFKLNQLCKKEKRFYNKWVKEKRCVCVKSLRKGEMVNCKHIRKAINIKFKKESDELWSHTIELGKKRLPQFSEALDRLK